MDTDDHRHPRFVTGWCDTATMADQWRGAAGIQNAGRSLGRMSAEPVRDEDPSDPEMILRDLPERERAEFLR